MEVIYNAVIKVAKGDNYIAKVFVDGIDRKKAAELTGSLRLRGLKLTLVQGRRDETDALIRLADRWAGCVRSGKEGRCRFKKNIINSRKVRYGHRNKNNPLNKGLFVFGYSHKVWDQSPPIKGRPSPKIYVIIIY